jgi:RNA polymerase sigma factor (sigma-70 family)
MVTTMEKKAVNENDYILKAEKFYPLVYKLVMKQSQQFRFYGLDPEDMVQDMLIRLYRIECTGQYDPDYLINSGKGETRVKAITYVHMAIRTGITSKLYNARKRLESRGSMTYNNHSDSGAAEFGYVGKGKSGSGGRGLEGLITRTESNDVPLLQFEVQLTIEKLRSRLKPRQNRVLTLILEGKDYKQIEFAMGYGEYSVRAVVSEIVRKAKEIIYEA